MMENTQPLSQSTYNASTMQKILPWLICGAGALFYCYEYFLRVTPSVMQSQLMQTFSIDNTAFGLLSAFYYYAYTPFQLPVGVLMDRFGPRRLLSLACFGCVIGTLLFAMHAFTIAAIGRFLVGAGSAFAFVGVLKLATIWLPPKRFAMVAGLVTALGMFGPMLGDILLTPAVGKYGWHNTVILTAIAGVVLTAFLYVTIRDKNQHPSPEIAQLAAHSHPATFSELGVGLMAMLRSRQVWLAGLIGCCLFLPISIFAELWGIPYLEQGLNFPVMHAAIVNPLLFLGFSLGGILGGWISDTIQRRREPMMIGGALACITACILFYASALSVASICILLFLIGFFSGVEVIVFAVSRESVPNRFAATAIAMTNFLTMLGGMVFQPVIGRMLDYHAQTVMHHSILALDNSDYRFALVIVPICLAISVILAYFVHETGGRPIQEKNRI
jgi:MFS family permease